MKSTPSERTHFKLDPYSNFGKHRPKDHPLLIFLKNVVGSGIPLLFSLYIVACILSTNMTILLSFSVACLTFIYILLDRWSKKQEISLFYIGGDLWLWLLLIVSALGLLINASEVGFWRHFTQMHWILLLYLFTYTFYLFPGIKRFFYIILITSVIVCFYGILQHFWGIDLLYLLGLNLESATYLGPPIREEHGLDFSSKSAYHVIGFFENHIDYGVLLSMLFCFPIAGLFLLNNINIGYRIFLIFVSLLMSFNLLWTYNKGIWISTVISLLFMSGFVGRKLFIKTFVFIAIVCGGFYYFDKTLSENQTVVLDTHYQNQSTYMDIWKAHLAMFWDHPWIGIGLEQNEVHIRKYYQMLNIDNWETGPIHNTYISWLSTTGCLGLIAYLLFILTFLLMTGRMWIEIPLSNIWHRTFILALLGVQVSAHVVGLSYGYFGFVNVQYFFIFALAMISYIYKKYNEAEVFDDHCL